jgi:UDP-glucose 4-epimerase
MLQHVKIVPQAPQRVVVVGAGGFVGSAIVRKLTLGGVPTLPITRKEVDLLQDGAARVLAKQLRADDSVVFVSARAPARNSSTLIQNLQMAAEMIAALSAQPVAHLVYVSSDAVYADDANPVTERSSAQPSSLHGMMHAARELILKSEVKVPTVVLRPTLLYGAADPHNGYGPNRFRRQADKGEPITLFGEGEEQRDHVYIDDFAQITTLVLEHSSVGTLNIATGKSASFRTVAELVAGVAGRAVEIRGSPRQNPITHRHFDITDSLKAFPAFRYTAIADGLALAAGTTAGADHE